jgi:hypothetical protein
MFGDLQIAIPSRSRHFVQKTIYNLDKSLWPIIVIVVPQSQYNNYRSIIPQNISIIPCDKDGIGPTREFILKFKSNGKVIMMDDDLTFYRRSEDGLKFIQMAPAESVEMIALIITYLDTYAIVGLADKFMSHTLPRQHKECARFNDLHGYNRDLLPTPWPLFRLRHGEEHDVQLQCITRGCKTVAITEYSKVNKAYANGGCSDYRTKEFMMEELNRMAELWPGILTLELDEKHPQGYRSKINWKEAKRRGGLI